MYRRFLKRPMDFILSLLAVILLSPVLLIVGILVRVKLGRPAFFKQKRPGLNERIFTLYKFRTMTDERGGDGELLPDEVRLTQFGKTLRATSLDELPELFNILKGDMSIVGPRPLLVRDMLFMTAEQRKRHTVLPGLTGLAQINGRNNTAWEKKLEYDLHYIDKITFFGDLSIILKTVVKVFRSEGITEEGLATAEDLGDYLLQKGEVTKEEYEAKQRKAKELIGELAGIPNVV